MRVERAAADPGLDAEVVRARLVEDGFNELPPPASEPLVRRVVRQLREPMALLLLVAAGVDGVALGERLDAAAILTIVVLNAGIALEQERRATAALEELRNLESPVARVRRGGVTMEVPAREIVVGDVVVLHAGDLVPADLRLWTSEGLEIDEALITGESLPVVKDAGQPPAPGAGLGERPWMAFSGSLVAAGSGEGAVVSTGARTVLGTIAESLSRRRPPATPLQRRLGRLTLVLGGAAVVTAVSMAVLIAARGGPVEDAVLASVALGVAAVPEGLASVTAVALALGVRRMAHRGAIVRWLPAVETLGSVTVLAFDKTGTVTENRMRLEGLLTVEGLMVSHEDLPGLIRDAAADVMALCSEAYLVPPLGDPVEVALLAALGESTVTRIRERHERVGSAPFDAVLRRMAVVVAGPSGSSLLVKGAPEAVIARCATGLTAAGVRPLTDADRAGLLARTEELAGTGFRLLALARRRVADAPGDIEDLERELQLVAIAALRDPVRPAAREVIADLRRAGIAPLLITGDHPGTAAAVAATIGLAGANDPVVTGAALREAGVPEEPARHPVYARVDPDQKLAIIDRLHECGEVVAMTGDGVNDAPALRAADIGVALGQTGSEVARDASDMVITDDDLATLAVAVREGRGIYANIGKVVDYLVSSNFSEILIVVAALVLFPGVGIPLLPLQILWVNLLTDGLPALALGLDPVGPTVMRSPPRDPSAQILGAARLAALVRRGVFLAAGPLAAFATSRLVLDAPWAHARTVLFTTLVTTHVVYALVVRPLPGAGIAGVLANRPLVVAVAMGLGLQFVVTAWGPMRSLFDTHALSAVDWSLAGGATLAVASLVVAIRGTERPEWPGPSDEGG